MSAEDLAKSLHWYVRRDGVESGPFPGALVTRYILLGRLREGDELSLDRIGWRPLASCTELIPQEFRGPDSPEKEALIRQARMREDERVRERRKLHERLESEKRRQERRQPESEDFRQHRDHRTAALAVTPESAVNARRLPWILAATAVLLVVMVVVWYRPGPKETPLKADCNAPGGPGINWNYCRKPGLTADDADLRNASLANATLTDAHFARAALSGANMAYADLRRADLSKADLDGANLTGAKLNGAKLDGARLTGADLSYADLRDTSLTNAELTGAKLDRTLWTDGRICAVGSVGTCR